MSCVVVCRMSTSFSPAGGGGALTVRPVIIAVLMKKYLTRRQVNFCFLWRYSPFASRLATLHMIVAHAEPFF